MTETATILPVDHMGQTAEIVAAYVSNNPVPATDLPAVIGAVHAALLAIAGGAATGPAAEPDVEKPTPAQIRKSVTQDALVSFIDGRGYKTLKRHLGRHGLDPKAYRVRYGLPADYPMTAPAYSEARSALAKSLGLGRSGKAAGEQAPKPKTTRSRKAAE